MFKVSPQIIDSSRRGRLSLAVFVLMWLVAMRPVSVQAAGASLKISPTAGVYEVGALVDIAMVLDTGGEAVNAVSGTLLFPPDKLQVVNPAASTSFVSIWVTAPTYSNTEGTVAFQGGLPNPGIKTSAGVISTITFRVKSPGQATLKFSAGATVLKNDGQGTNILSSTGTAGLTLKTPPPAGPEVGSPTHTDQNAWYNNSQVQFLWSSIEGATGYSYLFDQSPKSIPDETPETVASAVSLKAASDGVWFFHLRARTVAWGGVTTFPVKIDTTPPASFIPQLNQEVLTTEEVGIVTFATTDAASNIDHYEVKTLTTDQAGADSNTLFIEVNSPYSLPKLVAGEYTFIVRAIDRAGNSTEGSVAGRVVSGGVPFYARVPLLRNPAVANVALIVLGVLTAALVTTLTIRRLRLRATFRHDLEMLERDAQKKSVVLQRELDELREAQRYLSTGPGPSTPGPPVATPPTP